MKAFAILLLATMAVGVGYLMMSIFNDTSNNSFKKFMTALIIGLIILIVGYASCEFFPATIDQRPF